MKLLIEFKARATIGYLWLTVAFLRFQRKRLIKQNIQLRERKLELLQQLRDLRGYEREPWRWM